MDKPWESAEQALGNPKAGWVNRRDAAEFLGAMLNASWSALQAHREDPDVDVRQTVLQLLSKAPSLGDGAAEAPKECALEELMAACAKPGKRTVETHNGGFCVELAVSEERRQKVYVHPVDLNNTAYYRVYTYCGEATPELTAWALRGNAKMVDSSFALHARDEKDYLILMTMLERASATVSSVKRAVKSIGRYGDWVEMKLTGGDME